MKIFSLEIFRVYGFPLCVQMKSYLCSLYIAQQRADGKRLLGGELAMWSDHYCENRQCWDEANWKKRTNAPVASWMYKSEYDAEFSESMMGMVTRLFMKYFYYQ